MQGTAVGKIVLTLVFFSAALGAQTAETAFFRVVMLPSSEVPPVNSSTRGVADIFASVVRDNSGQIVSGTVDMLARVTFAAAANATALDIRSGASGQTGPVVFSSGISAASPRAVVNGGDSIHLPAQVTPDNTAGVAALRSLFQDPTKFYLNLSTTDTPNGAIRGQLQRAQAVVLMGLLNSANTVQPPNNIAKGVAQVVAIGTQDASGNWTSGEVYLTASYFALDNTAFTGFHIHAGAPGVNGAMVFNAALPAGMAPDPTGSATLGPIYTEVTVTNAAQAAAFSALFYNPAALYVDIHTTANPNGVARAQLRTTDSMAFPLMLDSANETAATSAPATAPGKLTVYTLRNEDGTVAAGTILADLDYRFAGPTEVLGIYLHQGTAGQNGPEWMPLATDFHSDTGFGNYFGWTAPVADPSVLEGVIDNPENYYASVSSLSDPTGAMRAQVAAPVTAPANVTAVISADLDVKATTVAPGELVAIFGTNLAKVGTDLSGWTGQTRPFQLNGASATIGGEPAPLLYVSPSLILVAVPVDIPPGAQKISVNAGNGPGATGTVNVAPVAPAIFFVPNPAVQKLPNYSLISPTNPAHAGDTLVIYATGLGQTSPPMATGAVVPANAFPQTTPVGVMIGDKPASVIFSIAAPLFTGLNVVTATVPSGVSGNVPLVIQQGTAVSNAVTITVQ